MARLKPFIDRQTRFKEANLGKIILFCEGRTEENYFKYFSEIISRNQNKYTQMEIVAIRAEGNAQRVLDYANDFWNDDKNVRTFGLYDKNLTIEKNIKEMNPYTTVHQLMELILAEMQKYDAIQT